MMISDVRIVEKIGWVITGGGRFCHHISQTCNMSIAVNAHINVVRLEKFNELPWHFSKVLYINIYFHILNIYFDSQVSL
jgi:hypothetical protein